MRSSKLSHLGILAAVLCVGEGASFAANAPPVVDWEGLLKARDVAMQRYTAERASLGPVSSPYGHALSILQHAGIDQALDAAVPSQLKKRVAATFDDYGFYLTPFAPYGDASLAEHALRRSLDIDPSRRLANLNLAQLFATEMPGAPLARRLQLGQELKTNYSRYRSLGGLPDSKLESALVSIDLLLKPQPATPRSYCQAIAEAANAGTMNVLLTDSADDVSVKSQKINIRLDVEGTAHVPTVTVYDAATGSELATPPFDVPDDLWGEDSLGLFIRDGNILLVRSKGANYPVRATGINVPLECSFDVGLSEEVEEDSAEPAMCHSIAAGNDSSKLAFITPATVARDEVSKTYGETEAVSQEKVDITNSGNPVNVLSLQLSSAAGSGCEGNFFDTATSDGRHLEGGPLHEQVLALQGVDPAGYRFVVPHCGNAASLFEHDGKTYFENKPQKWPPSDAFDQYHSVTRLDHGRVVNVCAFRFKQKVSVID